MKRIRISRDARVDLAIFAVLLLLAWPPTLSADEELGTGSLLGAILLPTLLVPIFLRRRFPVVATAVFAAACLVSAAPTFAQLRIPAVLSVGLLLAFGSGRRLQRWPLVAATGFVLLGIAIDSFTEKAPPSNLSVIAFGWPLALAAVGVGALIRSRDAIAAELVKTNEELKQRREQVADLEVEIERARLASELDAAARDRVREIVRRAEGAGDLEDPSARQAEFSAIERIGRESLNSMRELLGVLRSDERASRAPGPTLERLDDLLADFRRGGRQVALNVIGEQSQLPDEVGLAAYRTLQHALISVQGDGSDPVAIEINYLPDSLELSVRGRTVDGAGAAAALAAAQERVSAFGGTFRRGDSGTSRDLFAQLPVVVSG